MPKGIMIFNGKRYHFRDSCANKSEANSIAANWRKRGHLARVIPRGKYYYIYVRIQN